MVEPGAPLSPRSLSGGRIFGYLLLFIGVVWILLAGGCTISFVTNSMGPGDSDPGSMAVFAGVIAICVAPGLVCLYAGRLVLRSARATGDE